MKQEKKSWVTCIEINKIFENNNYLHNFTLLQTYVSKGDEDYF